MVNNLRCPNGALHPNVCKEHVHREEPLLVNILASAPRLDPEPQPENPETEGGSNFEKPTPPDLSEMQKVGFQHGCLF